MARIKNISGITGEEYKSIIDNVNGIGSAYNRANNAIRDFIESNKKYKDIMAELADLENKVYEARKSGGDVKKALQDLADAQKKYRKELQKIYKETKKITDEAQKQTEIDRIKLDLQQDINENLELEYRHWQKQKKLRDLEVEKIREGLTLQQEIERRLDKIGEKLNINTDMLKKGFGEVKNGLKEAKSGFEGLNKAWGSVDQAASQYTRTIGGSKASMEALRKSTINFMETRSIGIKYNTSMEELIKLQGDYNNSIGRSIDLTNSQKETFAAMRLVVGDQAAIDFTTKLENFGLNPDEVGDRVGKMFSKASKSGVAFEKYSKNFLENIKLAQNYNFQNGLKGLDSMAKKATSIRLDMQQVASFANKVSTLEGATTAGAQLSVLGGSFARMGNPLSMMYEGLNDMEALQDRMVKMFGDLGKWDYTKGQVDVSVFNKQRIKAASEATGMDYSKVMEMINAKARRNIVEGKLGRQYDNDKDFKELLLNKSQLDEQGNAFVTINGERKDINKLSKTDENYLKAANNSDSDNIAEIAVNTRGYKDIKEGFEKQKDIGSAQVNEFAHLGEATKGILGKVGEMSGVMKVLGAGEHTLQAIHGTTQAILGAIIIGKSFGRGGLNLGKAGGTVSSTGPTYSKTWNGRAIRTLKDGTQQIWNGGRVGSGGKFTNMTLGQRLTMGKVGGMGVGARMGAGLGLGVAGMGVDYLTDHTVGKDKGNNVGLYTTGKAASAALTGAGIGMMFGPWGALAGAAIGGLYGGIKGNIEAKKENIANNLRSSRNAVINDSSVYSLDELRLMQSGSLASNAELKQKMIANGDYISGFAKGGYTGDGDVSEVAGTVHKGEIVIPNSAVKASGNLMNSITVSTNERVENKPTKNTSEEIRVEPINVNFNGSISLNLNGNTTNIDSNQLIEAIKPKVVDFIIDQIRNRTDFRIDRSKTHKKFAT